MVPAHITVLLSQNPSTENGQFYVTVVIGHMGNVIDAGLHVCLHYIYPISIKSSSLANLQTINSTEETKPSDLSVLWGMFVVEFISQVSP